MTCLVLKCLIYLLEGGEDAHWLC
uniref:Uncharacterized protein n=1 Tax=Anguilla anguilla TaxID=7936 RepID=A0A0E9TXJ3_ANGAN